MLSMRSFASGSMTGSSGLLGFMDSGMETGLSGAGGASLTSGLAAGSAALSFETGLIIGSAMAAIIDGIYR